MAAGPIAERNQDATIYVGGLDEKVSETLLWELFLEAGPVGELMCIALDIYLLMLAGPSFFSLICNLKTNFEFIMTIQ